MKANKHSRFRIYGEDELRTGLRFDLFFRNEETQKTKACSIAETDIFSIEPIFYAFFEEYRNYGHWGKHVVPAKHVGRLLDTIRAYINSLKETREREFCSGLNEQNFGEVFADIDGNRMKVIEFASAFLKLVEENCDCEIVIMGV